MTARIGRTIGGLVGLGQEAYQHNKDKKAASAQEPIQDDAKDHLDEDNDEDDDDEDDWIADDAQQQLHPKSDEKEESTEQVVEWFKKRHPIPSNPSSTGQLPAPVVIPQKRPETRTRGFVRAYAPALESCGVEQAAFLDFIDGFGKEINKQNFFNVANLAVALSVLSYTVSVAPSVIVHFSAMAVHLSIEAGRRVYISKKTNGYIDEINSHYFQPLGLYAMIMKYERGSKNPSELLDSDAAYAAAVDKRSKDDKSKLQDYKASSGKTYNNQLPETCPLVFPELEKATEEQKENALKRSFAFTRDYYDRRSQAAFAAHDPDSKLNVQDHEFAGKYGDPTTFENSGILGVLSGGGIDPGRRRFERKNRKLEARGRKPVPSGQNSRIPGKGTVKRMLGDNTLYLMVVNMPSEEELQAAKEAEERLKRENPGWFEQLTGAVSRGS